MYKKDLNATVDDSEPYTREDFNDEITAVCESVTDTSTEVNNPTTKMKSIKFRSMVMNHMRQTQTSIPLHLQMSTFIK